MFHLRSFLSVLLITGTISLAGCSMGMFPDASVNPAQGKLGTISGNDFGGHAPLVRAHVYVLQPGITGYGSQATSLLTSASQTNGGSAGLYSTHLNTSDPHIPTTWYYETTDTTGSFNISGDYTCTVGQPVYLYLYGGSPTFPSASNTFNLSQVVIANTGGTYYATFTSTTTENAYIGESVSFAGLTGAQATSYNTGTYTVVATNLTTSTFAVVANGTTAASYTETPASSTAVFVPTANPGVVNLAVLGNCPNGTVNAGFGSSISYVYVNEVSTAAAAFAFQGFTLPTNNDAIHIGSSGTAQSLLGIENAALTAGQLYDIQGSNLSTVYAGEGHIARANTTAGNGIVPQTLLNSLGNILAACVDSKNTSTTIGNANISLACSTLFTYATNSGIPSTAGTTPGTPPTDIAAAAINIARHPAGAGTATQETNFMTNLYGLPTGNVPFAPNLTAQPNDFVVGILYPASLNPTNQLC
jgi:hypothetical protein